MLRRSHHYGEADTSQEDTARELEKSRARTKTPRRSPAAAQPPPVAERSLRATGPKRTTIAGVGASAGGFEAFSQLLHALPERPGLALVLVQHIAPQHESALPSLLGAKTTLPVVLAEEGMKVEANHVYVIPPNVQMAIQGDVLRLLPRPTDRSQYTPIDFFLRSLAESADESAIGVILSGTASDGSAGIREIKAVGGITIAQDPETAKYDGMPRAAIATGMVDLVLPLERLADELCAIARHPFARLPRPAPEAEEPVEPASAVRDEQLQRVFALLHAASGVDFKYYKLPTIERRLQRRMVLHKLTRLDQYVTHLQQKLFESVPLPLVALDQALRVAQANAAFCATFEYEGANIHNRKLFDLDKGFWKSTGLQAQLQAILDDGGNIDNVRVDGKFPRVASKRLEVTARGFHADGGMSPSLLLALRDASSAGKGS